MFTLPLTVQSGPSEATQFEGERDLGARYPANLSGLSAIALAKVEGQVPPSIACLNGRHRDYQLTPRPRFR